LDKFNYLNMQRNYYEGEAHHWDTIHKDRVVGWFNEHNAWEDYEFLFKDTPDLENKICLDFGCGPGRNMVRYFNRFKRIDGVDIASTNLEKAKFWIATNNLPDTSKFFECNGLDLSNIEDNQYDLIISTICMQHICVHEIRLNYFKEFYRVLKPGGQVSIQMGFGDNTRATETSEYHHNNYGTKYTNGGCDVKVRSTEQLENDLVPIGFNDFHYYVRPTGPGDRHDNWIFFNARKL